MTGEWRPIPGYDGAYEAGTVGKIRSTDRRDSLSRPLRGRVLRDAAHPKGYRTVVLSRHGQTHSYYMHTLVALTFHGPRPDGQQVRHLNGNASDNQPSNLAYGTASQNAEDQVRHGTHPSASRTECPQGHPYDELNTYHEPRRTARRCRTCLVAARADYYQRVLKARRASQKDAA